MAYRTELNKIAITHRATFDSKDKGTEIEYTTLEYPIQGLGNDRYPHFTIFYFNEIESSVPKGEFISSLAVPKKSVNSSYSKALSDKDAAKVGDSDVPVIPLANVPKGEGIKGLAVTTAVEAGNLAITATNEFIKLAAKGIALGVNGIKAGVKTFGPTRSRLKLAVCLPMPAKVRSNYNAAYSATDAIGPLGATILASLGGAKNMADTALFAGAPIVVGTAIEVAKSGAARLIGQNAAQALGQGLSESTIIQLTSKLSGRILNKRQEQLFNNMEFRAHAFEYLFVPRNKKESIAITEIIRQFKLSMHPSLHDGVGSSLLITPAEFDIEFRYKDKENSTVSRISTCALKSLDVNYTAIGEFVAFEGTPNPVAISLDMVFVEMEPLNREMIRKGY